MTVPPRTLPSLPSGTPGPSDLLLVDVGGVSSKCTVANKYKLWNISRRCNGKGSTCN